MMDIKRFFFIVMLVGLWQGVFARRYFIDAAHGFSVFASLRLQAGDTVLFEGGKIFDGALILKEGIMGTRAHPIVFGSYGLGKASIRSGNGGGIELSKAGWIRFENLRLQGSGRKEGNTGNGLLLHGCHDIVVDSLDISGYQKAGVCVRPGADIWLSRISAHDNGFAGISIEGAYGTHDCSRIRVTRCRAENNPGDPTNFGNHSGNGIIVGCSRQVIVEFCTATNNGWDMPRTGNGPVGIWAYESDSVVITHCTAFRNRTSKGGGDGGGFDLDGGMTRSVIEYCLSYENEGSGYGIFQYAGASAWRDNSIHDCVSYNDGLVSAAGAGVFIWNSSRDAAQFERCRFYNNTIYNVRGAALSYAEESEHRGFRFEENRFETTGFHIRGRQAQDDVFVNNVITGGERFRDTDGSVLNAHGAGMLFQDGIYYLFGEIKKGATWQVPGQSWEDYRVPAGGISCYSSRDLVHWKNGGIALASGVNGGDLDTGRVIERPKVIYNRKTGKYVMWMHIDNNDYSAAKAGVAISDLPQGPYRYLGSVRPNGQMSRDMTVFKDDDDRAYLVYTSEDNKTMQVCLLSPDYLSPTNVYTRILEGQRREAPAVFKHDGHYYLITSLCTGWDPNAALFAVADSMLGAWRQQGNPCAGFDSGTTFHSQSTYVLPLSSRDGGMFLFMADRWNKTDLEHSGYLWLPLEMKSGRPVIRQPRDLYRRVLRPGDHFENYELQLDSTVDGPSLLPAPEAGLGSNLRPFWEGDTVYQEAVLMMADSAHPRSPAWGRLLFQPDKILSVTDYGMGKTYRRGFDYVVKGNSIVRLPGSTMPFRWDSSFDRKDLAWYDLQGQWVLVSYRHGDRWKGRAPVRQGSRLPGLMKLLRGGQPVSIVAYGMSITRGMDVSSYHSLPPYTPNYTDLFVKGMQLRYPNSAFTSHNAGLPGAAIDWGAQYAADHVAVLHPDLVMIDFGMNDFWRIPPAEFRDSVRSIIRTIRGVNPGAEFVLIANMQFDPAYILDSDKNKSFYTTNMSGYRDVLRGLEEEGVIGLDMTSISELIYRRKKAKDCIVNPLHPNDYMARWYAQGLLRVCEWTD